MPLKIPALLASIILFCACNSHTENKNEKHKANVPAPTRVTSPEPEPQSREIHYTALALKNNDTAIGYFRKHFSEKEQELIYTLNRIDAKELWRPDTLIIPDTFISDQLAYSPFPAYVPALNSIDKMVLFSYPIQAFAAYEKGRLIRWGATSMGAKVHKTPTGLHFTNWKSKRAVSTVKDEWILPWNFNIMNKEGVGWHEYTMPGFPASHSCLRLHQVDAEWLYYWADQWILDKKEQLLAKGTPVLVYGDYPWGERRPWRNMLEHPDANAISVAAIEKEMTPYLSGILEAQQKRRAVEAALNPGQVVSGADSASSGF